MGEEILRDREPDTVATPEGDNEFAPDEPLGEIADGQQVPRGWGPIPYDSDKAGEQDGEKAAEHEHHHGILEVIDELSRGKMQT